MTVRQIGVRLVLVSLLLAPASYFGLKAWDSGAEVRFAESKLGSLREAIGIAQRDIALAKTRAQTLASAGIRAWGAGRAQERIAAAFYETDLVLEPSLPSQGVIGPDGQKPLVGFSRLIVRGRGTMRSAKEALWNLGDLGPGLRLESFKGELNPNNNDLVWTYVILAIDGPEARPNTQPNLPAPPPKTTIPVTNGEPSQSLRPVP
jgi:hypothetical protein